jgi:organic radical activating enzyme
MSGTHLRLDLPKLRINEIFGPTLQGEGSFIGQRALWVRLAICNLRCGWCDTAYTWAFTEATAKRHEDKIVYSREAEIHEMTVMEVRTKLLELADPCIVVFSGGEPLLQTGGRLMTRDEPALFTRATDLLGELAHTLEHAGYQIHIETAGTKLPGFLLHGHVAHYVVSPKLHSSGNTTQTRRVDAPLQFFAGLQNVTFKFVITKAQIEEDLEEVDLLTDRYEIPPGKVMLMPEGRTRREVLAGTIRLGQRAIDRGFGLSTRLQTLIWEEERKR